MRSRQGGAIVFVLVALLAVGFLAFSLWALSHALKSTASIGPVPGAAPKHASADGLFTRAWAARLSAPTSNHLAPAPGGGARFVLLNNDTIHVFDTQGTRVAKIAAPDKSVRLATDPTGRIPHFLVASRTTKWTGAIDHVVTTGYFLHALDQSGREVWSKRFDPKDVSSPDILVARIDGAPAVVFSSGKRILAFDSTGRTRWDLALWHHPFTVTPAGANLLAAPAPKKDIVRISAGGTVVGRWGTGDGPSRLAVMQRGSSGYAISLRQVFQRGPGVRHALMFFDPGGRTLREVELQPDINLVSYHPIAELDMDGHGSMAWIMPLNDGTLLIYSPSGDRIDSFGTGVRLRGLLAIPQRGMPDLLVTVSDAGLTGWKLNPRR